MSFFLIFGIKCGGSFIIQKEVFFDFDLLEFLFKNASVSFYTISNNIVPGSDWGTEVKILRIKVCLYSFESLEFLIGLTVKARYVNIQYVFDLDVCFFLSFLFSIVAMEANSQSRRPEASVVDQLFVERFWYCAIKEYSSSSVLKTKLIAFDSKCIFFKSNQIL